MIDLDWSRYPNFTPAELACRCGKCEGEQGITLEFMEALQSLRDAYGASMPVTDGFRCPLHRRETPEHRAGMGADILIHGAKAVRLLKLGSEIFPRLGINQKGPINKRFIHLGLMDAQEGVPSPWIWTY